MCSMQHVCRPNKSWSSNHELTAGVSAAVSVSRGQQPSFWLRPLPASFKHMQSSQQHVAVVSILPGLPEFSHGINFAMEVEMFGEPKGLIPLLSLGTNCLWSCRQVSSSAVHTGDTSDDAHVSGLLHRGGLSGLWLLVTLPPMSRRYRGISVGAEEGFEPRCQLLSFLTADWNHFPGSITFQFSNAIKGSFAGGYLPRSFPSPGRSLLVQQQCNWTDSFSLEKVIYWVSQMLG